MTAILAIDYYYQIIVIADCRVTWLTNPPKLQDNLQKVYPFGPTGVIGFAGGIAAAKAIVNSINQEAPLKGLPSTANEIVSDIANWAKDTYVKLPKSDQIYLELMYAAADYGQITLAAPNVVFAKNILAKYTSPAFEPQLQPDILALGYANQYSPEIIRENRDNMLNLGLDPFGRKFQMGITIGTYGEGLAKIAGDPVGGLFSVGVITARGVGWFSYSYGDRVELKIENGQFVQYDRQAGKRVPLKAIWDFDARRPDSGNLVFRTPGI